MNIVLIFDGAAGDEAGNRPSSGTCNLYREEFSYPGTVENVRPLRLLCGSTVFRLPPRDSGTSKHASGTMDRPQIVW